jgi:hypothetical protein
MMESIQYLRKKRWKSLSLSKIPSGVLIEKRCVWSLVFNKKKKCQRGGGEEKRKRNKRNQEKMYWNGRLGERKKKRMEETRGLGEMSARNIHRGVDRSRAQRG